MLNPADLCGWLSVSICALNRASRSAAQSTKNTDIVQPKRGMSCMTHIYKTNAGVAPNAITSDRESNSAPKRLSPFSMRAMRPSIASSTPAITIAATAFSQRPCIANHAPDKPVHSARAVTAFGASARKGIPGREECAPINARRRSGFDPRRFQREPFHQQRNAGPL